MAGFFRTISAMIVGIGIGLVLAPSVYAMGPASVSEMAAQLSGAVVNIGSSRQVSGNRGDPFPTLPQNSPLRDLFEELNPNAGQGDQALQQARSLGSGFLISAEGHIITNNHVIEGASEVLVYTEQGKRYLAEIIGADDKTDLAVLKISADRLLPFVTFGDSDDAEVGDWVMAIGNPFGLGGSVSLGIVSARHRNINSGPYDDFIQTDAAINLGNSGGPLFDMEGNVVGIVTAIIARGGNSSGIGFAVPANLAQPIIAQLSEFGETRRGWLGVGIRDVTEELAASLGQSAAVGALVAEITRGGPSEGVLEVGDVILLFNGDAIVEMRDLPRIVAQTSVGEVVRVQVIRHGELVELSVALGQLELGEDLVAASRALDAQNEISQNLPVDGGRLTQEIEHRVGFSVSPLSVQLRDSAGIPGGVTGLFINSVDRDSEAFQLGMRSGLVIERIGDQVIESIVGFETVYEAALGRADGVLTLKLVDSSGVSLLVALPIR